MSRTPRTALNGILLLALANALAVTVGAQDGGSITYASARSDLTVNEPVFLRFSFKNEGVEAVNLDVPFNNNGYGGFRGRIIRPDGRVVDGGRPNASELVIANKRRVDPSGSYSELLLLNRWGDFDVPGRYIVDIEAIRPIVTDGGVELMIRKDAHLVLEVEPRDPQRLAAVCSDLLRNVKASFPEVLDLESADALAHVKDPVAVPYLSSLAAMGNGAFRSTAIDGLSRIADEPAVDALITLANTTDDPIERRVARSLLGSIQATTPDPLIRQKILNSMR
jgi:hypothetical protein